MFRSIVVTGAVCVMSLWVGSARADDGDDSPRFGARKIIISADRLIPLVSYEGVKSTQSNGSSDTKTDLSLGLLSNAPYGAFGTFFNLPRLAFDWVPVPNLTLGGAIFGYTQLLAKDKVAPNGAVSTTTDQPRVNYWGFAPRIGYIVPLGHLVSFWPRVGMAYYNVSSSSVSGAVSPSVTQLAFEAEALFVISPWRHFGFTVGPTLDVPVTGKSTSASETATGTTGVATATSYDSSMFQVGVSAGMLGHF